ncbi:ER lumen protein-retaining receptor 2 [Dictyocoela muelleri]|nr:ER lumen protein-retaining receptor 2 [Dictyocoela muelleri]
MKILSFLALIFRLVADIFHVYTVYILCKKIKSTRSVSGLSYKTQLLYLIVFMTRYIDIFRMSFKSLLMTYNFFMKILFLVSQSILVYLIRVRYFYSYDAALDSFNVLGLLGPSAGLAFILMAKTKTFFMAIEEYLWTFSVLLEAVAVLPQLIQLQDSGEAETLTSQYILYLGLYRLFYVFNWILKIFSGSKVNHMLMASGIIQSLLYVDFFVVYYKHVFTKKQEKLPKSFK